MQQDFRALNEAELRVLVERALAGGASTRYTTTYLIDGGIPEELARRLVNEKSSAIQLKREQEQEIADADARVKLRKNLLICGSCFGVGAALIAFQQLFIPDRPQLGGVGCLFFLVGLRAFVRFQFLK